jgi:hypothetical protein
MDRAQSLPIACRRRRRPFVAAGALFPPLFSSCLLCFCATLGGQTAVQTPPMTPAQLLQSAALAEDWGDRYASVTNIKYRASIDQGPVHYVVGDDAVVKKYRDRDRQHIVFELLGTLAPNGAYLASSSRRETVLTGGTRVSWWLPLDKPLIGTVQIARSADRVRSMKLVDESNSHAGAFLDGEVDGLGSIIDIARAGEVSPQIRHEDAGAIPCDVIESTASTGRASLWIAPSEGYNLVKYLLEVNSGAQSPMRFEFEAAAFKNLDGRTVISAGRSQESWVDPASRASWHDTVQADRTTLNLHPEFSEPNLFTTNDIPDGVRVLLDDLPNVGVNFVWSHGKPVAKIEEDLFTDLTASLEKTATDEIPKSVPAPVHLGSVAGIEDARHRMTQLYIALCSIAAIMLAMLIGIYIRRGGSHAAP